MKIKDIIHKWYREKFSELIEQVAFKYPLAVAIFCQTEFWNKIKDMHLTGRTVEGLEDINEDDSSVIDMTQRFHKAIEIIETGEFGYEDLPCLYLLNFVNDTLENIFKAEKLKAKGRSAPLLGDILKDFQTNKKKLSDILKDYRNFVESLIKIQKEDLEKIYWKLSKDLGRAYRSFPSFLRDVDTFQRLRESLLNKFKDTYFKLEFIQDPKIDKEKHVDVLIRVQNSKMNKEYYIAIWLYQASDKGYDKTVKKIRSKPEKIIDGYNILIPIHTKSAKDYMTAYDDLQKLTKELELLKKFEGKDLNENDIEELKDISGWARKASDNVDKIRADKLGKIERRQKKLEEIGISDEYKDLDDVIANHNWILVSDLFIENITHVIEVILTQDEKGKMKSVTAYKEVKKAFEYPFITVRTKFFTFKK
jgi:hypothetical protein